MLSFQLLAVMYSSGEPEFKKEICPVKKNSYLLMALVALFMMASCTTRYVAKPLPFKAPSAYSNSQEVAGAVIGARAYINPGEAKENFGFDIINAGMLPVEVVIDNRGMHPLEINASQTFLEDRNDNLWPILERNYAYERATKYTETHETFKGVAQSSFLGAAAGAAVGLAIGILTRHDVGGAIGKGAVIGGVGGGIVGGVKGSGNADEARHAVMEDLRQKSLQARFIMPGDLSYGFIFFPGEAKTAKQLRLKIVEKDTGKTFTLLLAL
jgi:hypothetical protein